MKKEDLKIDLRAVPHGSSCHVLQYRINPNQDLTYYKEHNWFFGLIKFKTKGNMMSIGKNVMNT